MFKRPSERRIIAKYTYLRKLWGGRRTGAEWSFVSLLLEVYFLDLTRNTGISRQVCRSAESQATSQTLWNRFCICDKSPRRFLCKVWEALWFTNLGKEYWNRPRSFKNYWRLGLPPRNTDFPGLGGGLGSEIFFKLACDSDVQQVLRTTALPPCNFRLQGASGGGGRENACAAFPRQNPPGLRVSLDFCPKEAAGLKGRMMPWDSGFWFQFTSPNRLCPRAQSLLVKWRVWTVRLWTLEMKIQDSNESHLKMRLFIPSRHEA